MPTDYNKLCKFQIKVTMNYYTKHWWFLSSSNLQHNDHPPVWIKAQLGGEHDLSAEQMKFITQLYQHSVAPSTISDIMTKMVGKEFSLDFTSNLGRKVTETIDTANGITADMSSAQKTLECLRL